MRILLFLHCGINFGALSEESLKIEHKSQRIRFFVCLNLANMLQVLELFDSNIPLHQQHWTWHSEWYDEAWSIKFKPFFNIIFSKLQCVWVGGVVTLRMRSTEECQLHHIPTIRASLTTAENITWTLLFSIYLTLWIIVEDTLIKTLLLPHLINLITRLGQHSEDDHHSSKNITNQENLYNN